MNGDELSRPTLAASRSSTEGVATSRPAADGAAFSVDQILDGLAEGFFALDPNWRFIAFNRAAEEMFDIARERGPRQAALGGFAGIVGTEFDRRYRMVMSKREKQVFESYSIKRPDRYHEVRAFPLGDGIGVAFRDATDRQNILQTLRSRELELARVQEIGGVGGMRVDLAGEFTGSPFARIFAPSRPAAGRGRRNPRGLGAAHSSGRPVARGRSLSARVASGATQYKSEYRIVRPSDGAVRWIRAVAEIERDERPRRSPWSARTSTSPTASSPSRKRAKAKRSCAPSPTPFRCSSPTSTRTRFSASSTRPTKPGSNAR